ncbi:MAG: crotonase/enoyl-CoA hydratase family protein [Myxococcota bacterium]|nr:crotonase/enoyl-CoA hydratase family protein [Myxococcota bacterium]
MPKFETLLYEIDRGRARITLNRPEKRNALSFQLQAELHEALWEADNDTEVHGVILRGAGKSFCAGYDLVPAPGTGPPRGEPDRKYRGFRGFEDDAWQLERQQRLRMAIFDMHKPVVAQVHGHCLAGGTDIALLCDMIIAAEDAVFGFPPARDLGALPNNMWLYNLGPQWAKRLTLTGDTVTGTEAAQIGLALKAVPEHLLEGEVEGLMDRFAKIDVELLTANKRIVNLGLELMGARTLQRLAAENDARGHQTPSARGFTKLSMEKGLKEAIRERDAKFGDGRARVNGPEVRDERGFLIED